MPMESQSEEVPALKTEDTRAATMKNLKTVLTILAAVVPAVAAFFGAGETAKNQADEVKDKAESGYQFTREALTEIRESIKVLRENDIRLSGEIADLKRRARAAATKRKVEAAPPPAAVVAPIPAAPLPTDLDKALVQQRATTTP